MPVSRDRKNAVAVSVEQAINRRWMVSPNGLFDFRGRDLRCSYSDGASKNASFFALGNRLSCASARDAALRSG